MAGCFYSVGVGPGDPELLTLKAVRCIRQCAVIMIPTKDKKDCMAYQIACREIPDIDKKECISVVMPMTKDPAVLQKSHEEGVRCVARVLESGKDAAFLTIGDPTVYATPMYIHRHIAAMGFDTAIINGVPSFCAAAGRLGISLAEGKEQIHVIPASYEIEQALQLSGTKILMKAGKQMAGVKDMLRKQEGQIWMIENCGMENEKIWMDAACMPDDPGYYTLVIMKEKRGDDQ